MTSTGKKLESDYSTSDSSDSEFTDRQTRHKGHRASIAHLVTKRSRRAINRPLKYLFDDSEDEKVTKKKIGNCSESKRASKKPREENAKIMGATKASGNLEFLFKFKNQSTLKLIPSDEANVQYPITVMNFYERHIVWKDTPDNGDNDGAPNDNGIIDDNKDVPQNNGNGWISALFV
ncbi:heterochromatin protein 1-like [Contarinia nasturtii]|uniref:heterochromatin protein 1-like n=1 Tax=Contarinia nasturtii TaxID=265458 RepID=UPI0012D373FE|nr:heterochromatin protein 1-like [Contarinia nasturtii]